MEDNKLNALFDQPDVGLFKAEIARWQSPALIRLFRRLNKKAGEIKRGIIPGGQELFELCLEKMNIVALKMDGDFSIRAGVGPDGRSYFQDTQNAAPVALDGTRIGQN